MSQFDIYSASKRRFAAEREVSRNALNPQKRRDGPIILEPADAEARMDDFSRRIENYHLLLFLLSLDVVLALIVVYFDRYGADGAKASASFAEYVAPATGHVLWICGYLKYAIWMLAFADMVLTLQDAWRNRKIPKLLLIADGALFSILGYALFLPYTQEGALRFASFRASADWPQTGSFCLTE